MSEPLVTIVVSPRERFSCARESLESIYEHTDIPFELVYVDGNSPAHVKQYLAEQAAEKGFRLIRKPYYLSPNHARNLGLAEVKTRYVVFVDNDVIASPGWLAHLVQCAEETGATVVGPLMCQDRPVHEIVHFAGGESHILYDAKGRRRLREKMYKQGKRVGEIRDQLQRQETELAEFHCVLVRTAIFEQLGQLDEAMLNTKEHLDFCMSVRQMGGTVYFEPASLVTYVPGPPLEVSDIPYYMLRWSDAWVLNSLNRLREKWDLAEDGYFKTKYGGLGWRRRDTIIRPLVRRLNFGRDNSRLEGWLVKLDKYLNRYLTTRHAKQQPQPAPSTPPQKDLVCR
jgi:GT2 family glycosyltransferase